MKIKDLEDLRESLDGIITKAKDNKKSMSLIDIEKLAFHKFQKFIANSISIAKRRYNNSRGDRQKKENFKDEYDK